MEILDKRQHVVACKMHAWSFYPRYDEDTYTGFEDGSMLKCVDCGKLIIFIKGVWRG